MRDVSVVLQQIGTYDTNVNQKSWCLTDFDQMALQSMQCCLRSLCSRHLFWCWEAVDPNRAAQQRWTSIWCVRAWFLAQTFKDSPALLCICAADPKIHQTCPQILITRPLVGPRLEALLLILNFLWLCYSIFLKTAQSLATFLLLCWSFQPPEGYPGSP